MNDNRAHRILIVDDEINNLNALCQILTPLYDVIVAKNGQSALQKAQKHLPDLILLDIIMPDMTGFEVITSLKNSDLTRQIPVIFITGLDSSKNEEKGLLLGAADYITKPFHASIVKARVKTHLQFVEYINTLDRLCKLDALTNIPNRRYFDNQLVIEWGRALQDKTPIGVLMIDIDHFKKYNDVYGHPQGDVALKTVAEIFKQALKRPADFIARWGGEEFAALLPETDLIGALEVAERLRADVESAVILNERGEHTVVTVSIGVNATVPISNTGIEDFISQADKALYTAKSRSRNCVQAAL